MIMVASLLLTADFIELAQVCSNHGMYDACALASAPTSMYLVYHGLPGESWRYGKWYVHIRVHLPSRGATAFSLELEPTRM